MGKLTRILVLTSCLLLFYCTRQQPQPGLQPEGPHIALEHFAIDAETGGIQMTKHGAGVIISIGEKRIYAITSGHLFDMNWAGKRETIAFPIQDAPPVQARSERVRINELDLATVSFERETQEASFRAAKAAPRNPRRGSRVLIFGSPDGDTFRATVGGRILGYCNRRGFPCGVCPIEASCFVVGAPVPTGFSGGGAYNIHNELVGMCIAIQESESRTICISIESLMEAINNPAADGN